MSHAITVACEYQCGTCYWLPIKLLLTLKVGPTNMFWRWNFDARENWRVGWVNYTSYIHAGSIFIRVLQIPLLMHFHIPTQCPHKSSFNIILNCNTAGCTRRVVRVSSYGQAQRYDFCCRDCILQNLTSFRDLQWGKTNTDTNIFACDFVINSLSNSSLSHIIRVSQQRVSWFFFVESIKYSEMFP